MPRAIAVLAVTAAACLSAAVPPVRYEGPRALEHVRQLVAIGPRVAGTPGAAKAREYITAQLKALGVDVIEQPFDARTPLGVVKMVNLRATIDAAPGAGSPPSRQAAHRIIVGGHYDTKRFTDITFVGANDGGSSAAFLIELARVLKASPLAMPVELLWLDGEEATGEWAGNDHTYGSRHYAQTGLKDGTLAGVKAFFLVDMIGDRDLRILRESNSTRMLTDLVWNTAKRLKRPEFVDQETAIEDDHLEFLAAGVPSVDIIDLDYPAWHNERDTLDKVSAGSLQAVGEVLLAALSEFAAKAP